MNERAAQILHALVREFIASGEPVSSGWLYAHHDFGIRPAMIRAELNDLAEQGLLEQPHHSAGRVPRDKAYELYALHALRTAREAIDRELRRLLARHSWEEMVTRLSDELGLMGAVATPEHEVYKEGLGDLIAHLDWTSRDDMKMVIRDFEEFDERVEHARGIDHDGIQVFIGKKSPVTRSNQLAVMMRTYQTDGEPICVFAVGPKRMDYEKAARILKGLEERTEHDEDG